MNHALRPILLAAGLLAASLLPPGIAAAGDGGGTTRVGDLAYTVVGVERHGEIGFGSVTYVPADHFLVVRYQVRNEGSTVAVLRTPDLADGDGRIHGADWRSWVLPFRPSRFEALVPAARRDYAVMFDVAADGVYALVVHDGGVSERIPLDVLPAPNVAEAVPDADPHASQDR